MIFPIIVLFFPFPGRHAQHDNIDTCFPDQVKKTVDPIPLTQSRVTDIELELLGWDFKHAGAPGTASDTSS